MLGTHTEIEASRVPMKKNKPNHPVHEKSARLPRSIALGPAIRRSAQEDESGTMTGRTISHYSILEKLGEGGMVLPG